MSTTDTATKAPVQGAQPSTKPTEVAKLKAYGFHPLANTFPRMTKEEFKALVEDIRTNGLLQPIVLYQGAILDGRHRYEAAKEAKVELTERDFTEFTGIDPLKFVISQNLHRRHLQESQRALIAAEIAKLRKGANQYTTEDGSIDRSITAAATMLNVSPKSVQRARNVLDNAAPEVVAKIRQGIVRVGAVTKKVLALPKDQQAKAIETAKSEPNVSDKYDAAEEKLIERLKALPLNQAEDAAPATIRKLRAALEEKTEAEAKKKAT
jgi:hypothetical protein